MYEAESVVVVMVRSATSTDDFVGSINPTKPGLTFIIDAICVANMDSNNKWVHVGVQRSGVDIYLESAQLGNTERFTKFLGPFTVPSDYKVIVKFASPTAGDEYVVNIFGRLVRKLPPEVYLGE